MRTGLSYGVLRFVLFQDMRKAFMQGLQFSTGLTPKPVTRGIKRKAGYKESVTEPPDDEMKRMKIDEQLPGSASVS